MLKVIVIFDSPPITFERNKRGLICPELPQTCELQFFVIRFETGQRTELVILDAYRQKECGVLGRKSVCSVRHSAAYDIDCSEPSVFSSILIPSLNARVESRENWTPAQNGRLDGVGGPKYFSFSSLSRPRLPCFALENREAVNSLSMTLLVNGNVLPSFYVSLPQVLAPSLA